MRVAYVASDISLTFIVSEMEAHRQAGWEVLPLASCKRNFPRHSSALISRWCDRAVYCPGLLRQGLSIVREMVRHPVRFLRVCWFLLTLVGWNVTEFAKALYEFPRACYFCGPGRRFGVQHVHVHFASRSLSLGIMIGLLIDKPISCTVHAFDLFMREPRSQIPRLSRCKFIAAISNYNIEYLRTTCGEEIARLCRLVHCGIDLKKFQSFKHHPQPGRLLGVSNLVYKKGLEVAIRACEKLRDENVDFLFNIVGNGPLRSALEKLIRSLGLEDRVRLRGAVANDQLVPLLSEAWAFVLPCVTDPSRDMDGIPVAMMEAMACEVPVVSTCISGIPELVEDGVNGWLVPEQDVAALTGAIKRALSLNREEIARFGKAGREKVNKCFDIDATADQLRKIIMETTPKLK